MSSRLEQFMREHRDEFDSEAPAPQIWNKLEQELVPKKNKNKVFSMTILRWSAAAAILLLAGLGVFHLFSPGGQQAGPQGPVVKNEGDMLLKDINPTYAKEVYHFTQLIELKQNELKKIEKDNPDLYKKFIGDITKLDSSYNVLKSELPTNANREQLLEAMIQNLRLQTELLNQQLQIIQQINQSKNSDSDESNVKSI